MSTAQLAARKKTNVKDGTKALTRRSKGICQMLGTSNRVMIFSFCTETHFLGRRTEYVPDVADVELMLKDIRVE